MLNKYVGHENTDEVIKYLKCFVDDGTIYASQPLSFNDPAEFKVNINFDATKEEIRKKFFLIILNSLKRIFHIGIKTLTTKQNGMRSIQPEKRFSHILELYA